MPFLVLVLCPTFCPGRLTHKTQPIFFALVISIQNSQGKFRRKKLTAQLAAIDNLACKKYQAYTSPPHA